jgi:hypothetical protein
MKTHFNICLPFVLIAGFFLSSVANLHAQTYTEYFQDETTGTTVFTNNGNTFNLTSLFKIYEWSGWGHTGDDRYIGNDNDLLPSAGIVGSITNGTRDFSVHGLWIWPDIDMSGTPSNAGTVIFRGRSGGGTQFTLTVPSGSINTNNSVEQGYTYVDFSSYNSIAIDELQVELTGSLRYLTIDDFQYSGAPASITFAGGGGFTPVVMRGGTNQALGRFELTGDAAGASLTAASIKLNGTRTGLSNLKLWQSSDAAFGSDTQIGSTVAADPGDGNSVSFSGFSSSIGTGGTYYFLTGDVASDAMGGVHGVIVQNSSLTVSGGTLSGTITNAPLSGVDASLPVGLASFSARVEGRSVVLNWVTESETDNLGFILERSGADDVWVQIASYQTHDALKGRGNASGATEYAFTDQAVKPETEYRYRLSDVSMQGEVTGYAPLTVQTEALPATTGMEKAYPNPFNPQTFIAYKLSKDTDVNISVFDMLGRKVSTLHNGHQKAGSYHVYWNGTTENGIKTPSGGFIIRMQTDAVTQVQRVMFVK